MINKNLKLKELIRTTITIRMITSNDQALMKISSNQPHLKSKELEVAMWIAK